MRKAALIVATAATLAVAAVGTPAPAEARGGFGPGLFGGLVAGALIGGLASNAYGYGPGYGYYGGYGPGYYGGYAPAYYGGYAPAYYGYGYRPAYYGYDEPTVPPTPTTVDRVTMADGIATTGEVQREGKHPLQVTLLELRHRAPGAIRHPVTTPWRGFRSPQR
jgi:hypothetical protein